MRRARRDTIRTTGIFHKMWRGHNRERVLESSEDKNAYLASLQKTLTPGILQFVRFFSFCIMSNHPHETGQLDYANHPLEDCLKAFGNWMRNAHSRFGAGYNRRHRRQGKVAYDRPKTKEIDAKGRLLEVMFYGDANPVRAGMVSHPSRYAYSTYQFYANGKKSWFTGMLTMPREYLSLGKSAAERQKRYRELCDEYLRKNGLIDDRPSERGETPLGATIETDGLSVLPCSRGDPDAGVSKK